MRTTPWRWVFLRLMILILLIPNSIPGPRTKTMVPKEWHSKILWRLQLRFGQEPNGALWVKLSYCPIRSQTSQISFYSLVILSMSAFLQIYPYLLLYKQPNLFFHTFIISETEMLIVNLSQRLLEALKMLPFGQVLSPQPQRCRAFSSDWNRTKIAVACQASSFCLKKSLMCPQRTPKQP